MFKFSEIDINTIDLKILIAILIFLSLQLLVSKYSNSKKEKTRMNYDLEKEEKKGDDGHIASLIEIMRESNSASMRGIEEIGNTIRELSNALMSDKKNNENIVEILNMLLKLVMELREMIVKVDERTMSCRGVIQYIKSTER